MNGEKRFIPGTNPKWGRELPKGMTNSSVSDSGKPRDDGNVFDEWDYEDNLEDQEAQDAKKDNPSAEQITFDDLTKQVKFDPESAKKAREEGQLPENPTETPPENPENA